MTSKPGTVSQEAWDAAEHAFYDSAPNATGAIEAIARAIMAAKAEERDACISDLQSVLDDLPSHEPSVCLDMAIRAIRKRGGE